jgi:signal recognition particle receptor subunit beta
VAFLDPASGNLVVRIVYDGAPMAGKTTSVRALAAGVGGQAVSPREVEGRTLYFDWLDYIGGVFEGRRIRCQIVSVPGQALLASRRCRILESADAVVFVSDSTPEPHASACDYLADLGRVLRAVPGPPVGVIVQANKRDDPRAVPIAELRALLDRAGLDVGVIESVATEGTGIREAFVFAVRLALDRVRALMDHGALPAARPAIDSPEALYGYLRAGEDGSLDDDAEANFPRAFAAVDADGAAAPAVEAISIALRRESTAGARPARRRRPVAGNRARPPALPLPDAAGGLIWPPVGGRLRLHEALASVGEPRLETNGDWRAAAAGWTLHSPADAVFAAIEDGRAALLGWARAHAAAGAVASERRCLVLADDGAGAWRHWQIVAVEPCLRDDLHAAIAGGPATTAASLVRHAVQLLEAADACAGLPVRLPIGLRSLGSGRGALRYVAPMPYPADPCDAEAPPTDAAILRRLGVELAFALPAIAPMRDAVDASLITAAPDLAGRRGQAARRVLRTLLRGA